MRRTKLRLLTLVMGGNWYWAVLELEVFQWIGIETMVRTLSELKKCAKKRGNQWLGPFGETPKKEGECTVMSMKIVPELHLTILLQDDTDRKNDEMINRWR